MEVKKNAGSDLDVIYVVSQTGIIINSTKFYNRSFPTYHHTNNIINLYNTNFSVMAADLGVPPSTTVNVSMFMYRLPYSTKGTFIQQYDAGNVATSWSYNFTNCSVPSGTLVEQYWQTSNDNSTWSSWTNDYSSLSQSRYLRYKLNLSTTNTDKTPLCYMINFTYDNSSSYPLNPIMYVENNSFWNYSDAFEGPATIEDFKDNLNDVLKYCIPDSDDNCIINLTFSSESAGILEVYDLAINYSVSDSINPIIHNVSVNNSVDPLYNLIIKVNATDNIDLTKVNITLNNNSADLIYNSTSSTWDGNITAPNVPGQYELYTTATDWVNLIAYNMTLISVISSSADLTTYSNNITTVINPVENDNITINATIFNNGNTNANNFGVSLLIDNITNSTNTISVNANSNALTVFNWNAKQGNHTITISIDTSGIISEYNETNNNATILLYSYDGYPPQINGITADSVVENSPILIKANVTDNLGVSNVKAFINSQTLILQYNSTSNLYENSTALTYGNYELTITAEDISGLISDKKVDVSINSIQQDLTVLNNGITYPEMPLSTGKDNIINVNVSNLGGNNSGEFFMELKIDNITQSNKSHSVGASSINTTTFIWYGQGGNHTLTINLDIFNNVSESNETNNNITKLISVLNLNTPIINDIILSEPAYENEDISIKANVTSDVSISQVNATYKNSIITLNYNSTSELYEGITNALNLGNYYVNITAWNTDGLKTARSEPITVNSVNPDLTISYLDLLLSPKNVTEPNVLTINVTVHNNGGADANNFKVNITIGSYSDIATLSVNKASTSTATFYWTSVYGNYSVFVDVDSAKQITESNETNNNLTKEIFILDTNGPSAPSVTASLLKATILKSCNLKLLLVLS